jgi:hypothetical protein
VVQELPALYGRLSLCRALERDEGKLPPFPTPDQMPKIRGTDGASRSDKLSYCWNPLWSVYGGKSYAFHQARAMDVLNPFVLSELSPYRKKVKCVEKVRRLVMVGCQRKQKQNASNGLFTDLCCFDAVPGSRVLPKPLHFQ